MSLQIVISQEYYSLPKIPIYSSYPFEFPDSSPFSRTSNKNAAFYILEINEESTTQGAKNWVRNISYIIGAWAGYKLGRSIGKNYIPESSYEDSEYDYSTDSWIYTFNEEKYNDELRFPALWGSYYGWLMTWALFNSGDGKEKTKTTTYIVTLKTSGGDLVFEKKIEAKLDGKIFDINNSEFSTLALLGWYPLVILYPGGKVLFASTPSSVSFANANFNFIF